MTNEEILAKWRQRRGRITLSTAMEWSGWRRGSPTWPRRSSQGGQDGTLTISRCTGCRRRRVVGFRVGTGCVADTAVFTTRKVVVPGVIPVAYGVRPGQREGQK